MRILKEGDKAKAACPTSGEIEPITYFYREFRLESGERIPNVLQGICDRCGKAITIPAQSTPKIQKYIQEKDVSLEVHIPPVLEDVLFTIGYNSHLETATALKCIIQFYSNKIVKENNRSIVSFIVRSKNKHPLWVGTKRSRISLRISKSINDKMDTIIDSTSINKTEYITGILVKAKEDLIDNRNSPDAKKLYSSLELIED